MKHAIFGLIGFFGLIMLLMVAADVPEAPAPASYEMYQQTAYDTITNTGADTITLTPNLFSYWKYNYTVFGNQLSGTIDFDVTIQESNLNGGGEWYTLATDSLATDAGTLQLTGNVAGVKHRVIITGVGTQSSTYRFRATLKKEY